MALKTYIGARYTPKFMGEWDKNSEYSALSVVYTNEQSYVSRKTVPAQTEITNTEYWIKSADWNAQVAEYNQNVERYQQNVEQYNQNVETYNQNVSSFYADTLHSYDTKADMVADRTLALGETLLTTGDKVIGDGGGSFYQVVPETSTKAVALDNGLFALPFEFQPYDYSEFQGEVDRVVENFNKETQTIITNFGTSVAEVKAVSLGTYNNVSAMKADTKLTANTTVLTTGETTVGDNKGSFYRVQDTSDRSDAVTLDNGKKAVPFALDVGEVAGAILAFNGQTNAPGVWNVKAPGSITIPLTVNEGGTVSTFVAVLYTVSQNSVNINININNGNVRTITVTDTASTTQDKIVLYAITAKINDGAYYWSSNAISSWNITYSHDAADTTVYLPAGAPTSIQARDTTNTADKQIAFKVKNTLTIKTITVNFPAYYGGNQVAIYSPDTTPTDIYQSEYDPDNPRLEGTVTLNINKEFVPNKKYYLYATRATGPTSEQTASTIIPLGDYGDITVIDDSLANRYGSYIITYNN